MSRFFVKPMPPCRKARGRFFWDATNMKEEMIQQVQNLAVEEFTRAGWKGDRLLPHVLNKLLVSSSAGEEKHRDSQRRPNQPVSHRLHRTSTLIR